VRGRSSRAAAAVRARLLTTNRRGGEPWATGGARATAERAALAGEAGDDVAGIARAIRFNAPSRAQAKPPM
jgi:hypothetical protein